MTNRESKFSRPSAATHHLTQASTTLNRRYVKRPTVIAIDQPASDTAKTQPTTKTTSTTSHTSQNSPNTSRLVNLGVHAKDLPHTVPATTNSSTTSTIKVSVKASAAKSSDTAKTITKASPESTTKTSSNTKTTPTPAATHQTAQSQPSAKTPDSITQLDTLKAFAAEVKLHPDNADMQKLSATIDKFINTIEKSDQARTAAETKIAATVTTSPKITRAAAKPTPTSARPSASTTTPKPASKPTQTAPKTTPKSIQTTSKPTLATPDLPAQTHPLQRRANHHLQSTKTASRTADKPTSSKDIKDRAIKQALRSVATMNEAPVQPIKRRKSGGAKRFILAFTCAAACLAAIIYFVSSNIPDVSVRVAAMQTGIEASYPSYVPMDYSLSDIISEDGKLTMIFNGPDGARFTLVQEKSSWDSATLLRNYVEPTWGDDYVTTHEQGITIYISNQTNDSTWVNGGIRYSITSEGTRLTKKQTRNIVLSL